MIYALNATVVLRNFTQTARLGYFCLITPKKALPKQGFLFRKTADYIMPPISGGPAGMAGLSSGSSATMASVVIIKPAIEAAF